MLIDVLTTAALADTLAGQVLGARLQSVVQPDRGSLALELYAGQRHYLVLRSDGRREAAFLSEARWRRGDDPPTPLALAVAARLEGARLVQVVQPPWERILRLAFAAAEPYQLVAELTGRLANLILLDAAGTVLAAAHPVTAAMSRARQVLPGQPYRPPPSPGGPSPDAVSAAEIAAWLAAEPAAPAWRTLVRRLRGLSPLAAREALARATGDAEIPGGAADAARVQAALADLYGLLATRRWAPSLGYAREADGRETLVAYAPYPLSHLDRQEPVAEISLAILRYEAERLGEDPYRAARAGVAAQIGRARDQQARTLAALEREGVAEEEIARLKLAGDMILALQRSLRPGQTELEVPPEAGPPMRITLAAELDPVGNAQRYYRRHRAARRAAEALPERRAAVEARLATLDQLETDLLLAEDRPAIDAVYEGLRASGLAGRDLPRRVAGAPTAAAPLRLVSESGFTILVGRNSRQNERVTFELGARGDLWLHARDLPGAHVLIRSAGRPVPEATVEAAAALAAWFSRGRTSARVPVAITDWHRVRRLKGGGPGMVTFEGGRTVTAAPRSPEALADELGVAPAKAGAAKSGSAKSGATKARATKAGSSKSGSARAGSSKTRSTRSGSSKSRQTPSGPSKSRQARA